MIITGVYTVFDAKAEHYLPPFSSQNDGTAVREFATASRSEGHMFSQHAADYALYKVGAFDLKTATLNALPFPVLLGRADEAAFLDQADRVAATMVENPPDVGRPIVGGE